MRSWFEGVLLLAVGVSVSLMVFLIAAQVSYTGASAPFSVLAQSDVLQAIRLSVVTASVAALLALALALPTGYAMARWEFPGRSALECLPEKNRRWPIDPTATHFQAADRVRSWSIRAEIATATQFVAPKKLTGSANFT